MWWCPYMHIWDKPIIVEYVLVCLRVWMCDPVNLIIPDSISYPNYGKTSLGWFSSTFQLPFPSPPLPAYAFYLRYLLLLLHYCTSLGTVVTQWLSPKPLENWHVPLLRASYFLSGNFKGILEYYHAQHSICMLTRGHTPTLSTYGFPIRTVYVCTYDNLTKLFFA